MQADPVLAVLIAAPGTPLTIHQISLNAKRSYGWTYYHVQQLEQEGVISVTRIGKALVCALKAAGEGAIGALCHASGALAGEHYQQHPADKALIASIMHHIPSALSVGMVNGIPTVLARERHGKHVIDGRDIVFVTPDKRGLEQFCQGRILAGYESFWRLWGESHA